MSLWEKLAKYRKGMNKKLIYITKLFDYWYYLGLKKNRFVSIASLPLKTHIAMTVQLFKVLSVISKLSALPWSRHYFHRKIFKAVLAVIQCKLFSGARTITVYYQWYRSKQVPGIINGADDQLQRSSTRRQQYDGLTRWLMQLTIRRANKVAHAANNTTD